MQAITLEAQKRKVVGKKVKQLRKSGLIPVSVYGKDVKSEALEVKLPEFMKVYAKAGETGLVELKYDGGSKHTLISNVQMHPVLRSPLHVEFHAVNLKEKIKANVPVELVGESPAVVNGVGLLLQTLNEVEVEALPANLPEKLEVDATKLLEVDQQVNVGELKVAADVEVLTDKETVVVKVVSAVSEETKKEIAAEEAAKAAAAATPAEGEPAVAPGSGEAQPTEVVEKKEEAA